MPTKILQPQENCFAFIITIILITTVATHQGNRDIHRQAMAAQYSLSFTTRPFCVYTSQQIVFI